MTHPEAASLCTNCGKPLPPGVPLCANCGAATPPLPVLSGATPAGTRCWTKSRGGDIALGILEGGAVPLVLGVAIPALLVWLVTLAGSMLGYLGISIAFLGSLLCWGGAIFWYVHARRKSPYLYAQVARKVAIGWLVVAGLAVAGLLTTCLSGLAGTW